LALPLPPAIGRDALFEAATCLNPAETIFDVASDARWIAAEEVAGGPCDPSDRFAKISGRDWKYLFKQSKVDYNLFLTNCGDGDNENEK